MIRVAFVFNAGKLSGILTRIFTGCSCYHVAFVDEERGLMYDMNLLRRRRPWPHYADERVIVLDAPVPVPRAYLEERLTRDDARYGVLDYCLFALRPLYHLVGKSTRNAGGTICSEMVASDLQANGWSAEFAEVPSPCQLFWTLGGAR